MSEDEICGTEKVLQAYFLLQLNIRFLVNKRGDIKKILFMPHLQTFVIRLW